MDSVFVSLRMGKLGKGNEDSHDHISVYTDRKFLRVKELFMDLYVKGLEG